MATIAFMPPREVAGIAMFSNPLPLRKWPHTAQPDYDRIYVVRIDDANPAHFQVRVSSIPVPPGIKQTDLNAQHLKDAEDPRYDFPSANSGKNLDLKFDSTKGALVIFHLTDPNARFVEADVRGEPSNGIVRSADEDEMPDLIFQANWVTGNAQDREAVSVILKGVPKGQREERQYGLGVQLKNDDTVGSGYTNIIIDPKVENEGHN